MFWATLTTLTANGWLTTTLVVVTWHPFPSVTFTV
jgi:hypothetical protein